MADAGDDCLATRVHVDVNMESTCCSEQGVVVGLPCDAIPYLFTGSTAPVVCHANDGVGVLECFRSNADEDEVFGLGFDCSDLPNVTRHHVVAASERADTDTHGLPVLCEAVDADGVDLEPLVSELPRPPKEGDWHGMHPDAVSNARDEDDEVLMRRAMLLRVLPQWDGDCVVFLTLFSSRMGDVSATPSEQESLFEGAANEALDVLAGLDFGDRSGPTRLRNVRSDLPFDEGSDDRALRG